MKRGSKVRPWTTEEVAFLKANRHRMPHAQIAEQLGRSRSAVDCYLFRMSRQTRGNAKKWTDSEITFLHQNRWNYSISEIGGLLGRTKESVKKKVHVLRLHCPVCKRLSG